ncbi:VOC family protein [Granulicella arctica]|uniref:VOC family protein n=1 Tax=Granulicella arctica TaxID=940613 RepID=UPI0021E0681F|nr:VOC family protein [Granulicella arctica]
MLFTSTSFELHVRDLAAARHFYVDQLGLPVLQETSAINLLAVLAGTSRLSIFGDRSDTFGKPLSQLTLGTQDIDSTIAQLRARGVTVEGQPVEAAGFMRFVVISDPEGNSVGIAQHLRDPLAAI